MNNFKKYCADHFAARGYLRWDVDDGWSYWVEDYRRIKVMEDNGGTFEDMMEACRWDVAAVSLVSSAGHDLRPYAILVEEEMEREQREGAARYAQAMGLHLPIEERIQWT